ncbi:MAG: TraB/GumN family protein [Chitinispirillaceae bacterium]
MKISRLILTAFLAFVCCTPSVKTTTVPEAQDTVESRKPDGYSNKSIGIEVSLSDNWSYYTKKEDAPEVFKSAFERKTDSPSLLFVGNRSDFECFIRCTAEKTRMPVDEYFPAVFDQNKKDLQPLSAKITTDKEVVRWTYTVNVNGIPFIFDEGVFRSGDHIVRIGLWSGAQKHDFYQKEIDEIISSIIIDENGTPVTVGQKLSRGMSDVDLDYTSLKTTDDIPDPVSACEGSHPLIYQIDHAGNTVYLLGSVHYGHEDFYPLGNVIDSVFALSKKLMVEINSKAPDFKEKSIQLLKAGMLEGGKTLEDVISDSAYAKTEKTLEELGMPISHFKNYRPWFLALTLEMIFVQASGYDVNYGIDAQYLEKAQKSDKQILEIESVEEQIKLLEELDNEEFLLYSLESNSAKMEQINSLLKAYLCGDDEKLVEIIFSEFKEEPEFENFYKKLITDRNYSMSEYIENYLNSNDEPGFVVVGSGHVVGPEGIVEILEKRGFQIRKL